MRRFDGNRRDTFYAATVLHHRSQHTNVSLQECHICNVRMSCHYRCYGVAYCMFDRGVSIAQKMPPYEIIVTTPPKCHSWEVFCPSFVCTSRKIQNVPVVFSVNFLVTCAESVFFPEMSERMCFRCRTDQVLAHWCQFNPWNCCPRLRKLKAGRAR